LTLQVEILFDRAAQVPPLAIVADVDVNTM
jgi:hypothetical protein